MKMFFVWSVVCMQSFISFNAVMALDLRKYTWSFPISQCKVFYGLNPSNSDDFLIMNIKLRMLTTDQRKSISVLNKP